MIQKPVQRLLAGSVASLLILSSLASAETWTDSTGKFRIEAEFVGVEGRNIVLLKADGTKLNVPIDRLSAESRAQAKKLYEMAKSGGGSAPAAAANPPASANAPAQMPAYTPAQRNLNFTPPQPVTVPPMPAFPNNASLQESFDFVKTQILAGHPEVLWHAMPDEIRQKMDSEEMRSVFVPALQQQAQMSANMEKVFDKAVEVLVTKKEFVLGSPMMAQVPPNFQPLIQQGYDPAVGLLFELTSMQMAGNSIDKMSITQLVDYHGPRIGGHLQALSKLAPAGMIDGFVGQIKIDQTSETTGTITSPSEGGGTEVTEMVKYQGRWLPKDLADKWVEKKDTMVAELKAQVDQQMQNPQAMQQAQMASGMIVTMANGVLDPMLQANSQAEFDQAVMQIVGMMSAFGGGGPGGPGGFGPPGGAGPGGAGGFGPPPGF